MRMPANNNNVYYVTFIPTGPRVNSVGPGNLKSKSDMCQVGPDNRSQIAIFGSNMRKFLIQGDPSWCGRSSRPPPGASPGRR